MNSSMNDFVAIVDCIVYFLTYPFPIFGYYLTLEQTIIFTETVTLAFSALRKLYE